MIGCVLPGGNASEFVALCSGLNRRGVRYVLVHLANNGVAFLLAKEDLHKLPHDEKGPYLGNDDSGHSIYEMDVEWLSALK